MIVNRSEAYLQEAFTGIFVVAAHDPGPSPMS